MDADGPDPPHGEGEDPAAWGRRIGAVEGTGVGLVLAGALMGMVWLGSRFGGVLSVGEGRYALMFLATGAAVLAYGVWRRDA